MYTCMCIIYIYIYIVLTSVSGSMSFPLNVIRIDSRFMLECHSMPEIADATYHPNLISNVEAYGRLEVGADYHAAK